MGFTSSPSFSVMGKYYALAAGEDPAVAAAAAEHYSPLGPSD